MPHSAAFFDLDRTLIAVHSTRLYLRREYEAGRLRRGHLLRGGVYLFLYHLALVDLGSTLARAARGYAGLVEQELQARIRAWFDRDLADRMQPGAAAVLEGHRRRGEERVLLTATSSYLAEAAAHAWQLDGWIANVFEVDPGGSLTGRMRDPVCAGAGKVRLAERWAAERDVDLSSSYFYTDSFTDLPMLERVGEPRIVNPDPRLRRLARRRGWTILDWSAPL